jgi:hypothetical protein
MNFSKKWKAAKPNTKPSLSKLNKVWLDIIDCQRELFCRFLYGNICSRKFYRKMIDANDQTLFLKY